jgi:hypothetical protein
LENLVGRGNSIQFASEYDLKVVIILFKTCFETLNPTIKTCTSIGHSDELQNEGKMFGLEHPLRNLLEPLSLKSYFCSRGYPYSQLHMKILLFGGATMKDKFQKQIIFSKFFKMQSFVVPFFLLTFLSFCNRFSHLGAWNDLVYKS